MLCDDPSEGVGAMGGRLKGDGIYVYIQLIYFVVQQKLMQHCKAIVPHFFYLRHDHYIQGRRFILGPDENSNIIC